MKRKCTIGLAIAMIALSAMACDNGTSGTAGDTIKSGVNAAQSAACDACKLACADGTCVCTGVCK